MVGATKIAGQERVLDTQQVWMVMVTKPDNNYFLTIGLGLLIQAGAGIWWLASLDSRVSHNDFQIQMMDKEVKHNSQFVQDWPAGKWGSGSLPDDVRQNLKIAALEKQVAKMESRVYNGTDH